MSFIAKKTLPDLEEQYRFLNGECSRIDREIEDKTETLKILSAKIDGADGEYARSVGVINQDISRFSDILKGQKKESEELKLEIQTLTLDKATKEGAIAFLQSEIDELSKKRNLIEESNKAKVAETETLLADAKREKNEAVRLLTTTTERVNLLETRESNVKRSEESVDERESQLVYREKQCDERSNNLSKKEAIQNDREAQLNLASNMIDRGNREITEKRLQLSREAYSISVKIQELNERQSELDARESLLVGRETDLQKREVEHVMKGTELDVRERILKTREKAVGLPE